MSTDVQELSLPGIAFDTIADSYDSIFTSSLIGRAQRERVWSKVCNVFRAGDHILELNCGTGEDALSLAQHGITVTACDASTRMIARAQQRLIEAGMQDRVRLHTLCTEHLEQLERQEQFDGVFSNFSGLNCVQDLKGVALQLAKMLKPGGQVLLCMSTRYCAWEIGYYLCRGNIRKAFRRCGGSSIVDLGSNRFRVSYPTLRTIMGIFQPIFRFHSVSGVGIGVPPSYLENWMQKYPRLLKFLKKLDTVLAHCPGIRILGDHMLLHMEKV